MKKLLLILLISLCNIVGFSQIKMFDGSLDEAQKIAKAEGKTIMIMCSATWCGPCKAVERNVLTKEEFYGYINDKFIFIKHMLDIADPDKLVERFNITAYPTFLFLNHKGEEVTRVLGATNNAQEFADHIKRCTQVENSHQWHKEEMSRNPSHTINYAIFLETQCGMKEKSSELLASFMAVEKIENIVTKENISFFLKKINRFDSPILKDLLQKIELVDFDYSAPYAELMRELGTLLLVNKAPMITKEFMDVYSFIESHSMMQTEYFVFIKDNLENLKKQDRASLYKDVDKYLRNCDTETRKHIVTTIMHTKNIDFKVNFDDEDIKLNKLAAKYEKDKQAKESYKKRAKSIAKPEYNSVFNF